MNPPKVNELGEFRKLGEEFINRFHTKKTNNNDRHAYYAFADPADYIPVYESLDPPLPLDFFYVALIEPEVSETIDTNKLRTLQRRPLFCLAARPDSDLYMVTLSLLDPDRTPHNFDLIERYITRLLKEAKPLTDLMK